MGHDATDPGTQGWLVAILELGAWVGVLLSGYLADKLSRKYTIVTGTCARGSIRPTAVSSKAKAY